MKTADRILIVILALLLCATTLYAFKPQASLEGNLWISVDGQAIAKVQPDTLTLNFRVEEKATTTKEAQTKIDEVSKQFIALIKELGVDAKNIQTSNYSVYQNYYWDKDTSKQIEDGYNASQSITVTLDGEGFVELGESVLSAAPTVGNITIHWTNFSLKDKSKGAAEVRAQALEAAYKKAQQLAEAAGVKLWKPTIITESSTGGDYYPIAYNTKATANMDMGEADDSAGLEAGESEVRVIVNVTYEIK